MQRELQELEDEYNEAWNNWKAAELKWAAKVERTEREEAERQRRIAAHDAREAAKRAEEKVIELRRKAQAAEARAAKAEVGEKAFTAYCAPPASQKSAKKKARAARRTDAVSMVVHEVHVSDEQKALRSAAFDLKQELEHAEKLARVAKEKADGLRKLAADASAAVEAANHVVPPKPMLVELM